MIGKAGREVDAAKRRQSACRFGFIWFIVLALGVAGFALNPAVARAEAQNTLATACLSADPNRAEDVFRCFSSLRLNQPSRKSCRELATLFLKPKLFIDTAKTGLPSREINQRLQAREQKVMQAYLAFQRKARGADFADFMEATQPVSCRTIARAVEKLEGQPPYWSGCVDYREKAGDADYAKACLTRFLPAYNHQRVENLQKGCAEIQTLYRNAANAASLSGRAKFDLPPCEKIASVFVPKRVPVLAASPWSRCLDFDPEKTLEHLKRCVDLQTIGREQLLTFKELTCPDLRGAYETGLKNAYGGTLPDTYRGIECGPIQPVLAEMNRKMEEARKRMAEEREKRRIAANRQAASNASGASGAWLSNMLGGLGAWGSNLLMPFTDPVGWFLAMIRFDGNRLIQGGLVQFLILVLATGYAWHMQRKGAWWVPKGVIFEKVFYARFKLANLLGMGALVFFLDHGLWFGVGALLAALLMRFIHPVLADIGLFKAKPVEAGVIDKKEEPPEYKSGSSSVSADQDW